MVFGSESISNFDHDDKGGVAIYQCLHVVWAKTAEEIFGLWLLKLPQKTTWNEKEDHSRIHRPLFRPRAWNMVPILPHSQHNIRVLHPRHRPTNTFPNRSFRNNKLLRLWENFTGKILQTTTIIRYANFHDGSQRNERCSCVDDGVWVLVPRQQVNVLQWADCQSKRFRPRLD